MNILIWGAAGGMGKALSQKFVNEGHTVVAVSRHPSDMKAITPHVIATDVTQPSQVTVGLRGLGMPAPSKFNFKSGTYTAELTGLITSELALSLFGRTRIRAYGFLNFNDNTNNTGKLTVDRNNKIELEVNRKKLQAQSNVQGRLA